MQLKATAEKLAFLRQVAILEGSNSRQHLTQLHFVLEKCTIQRGHVIIMEGQPCAGMFFIVTGQVAILARRPTSAADAGDSDAELTQHASSELQASRWDTGPTSSWWGQAGADQHAAGENALCSCCFTALGSAHMLCSLQMSTIQVTLQEVSSASLLLHIAAQNIKLQAPASLMLSLRFVFKPRLFASSFVGGLSSQDSQTCAHTQSSNNTNGALLLQQ